MRKTRWSISLFVVTQLVAATACHSPPTCKAPPADSAAVQAVTSAENTLAVDLYARLSAKSGNLFFSPYSITTAMAMVEAGARAETADEMRRVMHLALEEGKQHPAFAALSCQMETHANETGNVLSIANAVWGQKSATFLPDYLKLLELDYGSPLQKADFIEAPEPARSSVNGWVEKQTDGHIKELFQQGAFDANTRLVLANAIFFKGRWAKQFDKARTSTAPFHLDASRQVDAQMMRRTGSARFLSENGFSIAELAYEGEALAMDILLPDRVDGLADLERSLTSEALAGWLSRLNEGEVDVTLPRFRATASLDLRSALSGMGMPRAFDPLLADFSGMDGEHDLFVSSVVHQAFVDVNEEGTTAGAASGAIMSDKAAVVPSVIFLADHPFFFLIRDLKAGSVLFIGRLADPSA